MQIVDIREAKTHLSRLLKRVAVLETAPQERTLGLWAGQIRIAEDFDDLDDTGGFLHLD